jgi:hypothetical protein
MAKTGSVVVVADRADLVVGLDCERVLGDVDANGAAGVDAAKRDGFAADGDPAVGADAALNGDRLGAGSGRRAGGTSALQAQGLLGRERVRANPEQLARVGVQDIRVCGPMRTRSSADAG